MQNEKTIESIRQLFALLEQHGAILGRTQTHIVIDRQAMPGVVDWMIFSRYSLKFDSADEYASQAVFSSTSTSKDLVFLDISGIETGSQKSEHFKAELTELAKLYSGIKQVDADIFAAVKSRLSRSSELLEDHGAEILEALFTGEIQPMKDEKKH